MPVLIGAIMLGLMAAWLVIGMCLDAKRVVSNASENKITKQDTISVLTSLHWLAHLMYLACWPFWENQDQPAPSGNEPSQASALNKTGKADTQTEIQRATEAMKTALDATKWRS
jgi:hypothetical protein